MLVPWYLLGLSCGIRAPAIKAIVELASRGNDCNYLETGLTLERFGVKGTATAAEILEAFGGR